MGFHLNPEQRLQLIEALAAGREVEMAAQLELFVQAKWITNAGEDTPGATIPVHLISFNVDSTR